MPENTGALLTKLIEGGLGYIWFLVLALWGGTVSYIGRIRKGKLAFSFAELIGEWSISGFTGIITAYICAEMQFSFYMTAALVAISGHMGGRALSIFENWFKIKFMGGHHERLQPREGDVSGTSGKGKP